MRLKQVLRNFSFTITSNFLTLFISTIVILIVPKIIGVYEYGLWQLFLFYSSYVGILHFGWLDGIYLRYGGSQYEDLDKSIFKAQYIFLLGSQVAFSIIVSGISYFLLDGNIKNIIYSVAILIVIVNLKTYFQFILQMTNRISEYAMSNIIYAIIYAIVLILLIFLGVRDYRLYILSYILSQTCALIYCLVVCKDIICIEAKAPFHLSFDEIKINLSVGVKLVLSNVAGMLIVGTTRLGIQYGWSVTIFGKISLILNISSLLMVFVNSISLVLFPLLRRINPERINSVYNSLRNLLMPIVFVGMLIYFPIKLYMPLWLPKYNSALIYMSILFPMVAYTAKFEALSNTFLKVLRMERQLMFINIVTLILSVILTLISVGFLHSLTFTVLVIIIVMTVRSVISEWYINQKLRVSFFSEILMESMIVGMFMLSTWYLSTEDAFIVYFISLVIYLFIKYTGIKGAIKYVKHI